MPRDRSKCPNCGERVSPFAAGCAVCGADLDPSRWDTGPSVTNRVGSFWSAVSMGGYGLKLLIGLVIGLFLITYFGLL